MKGRLAPFARATAAGVLLVVAGCGDERPGSPAPAPAGTPLVSVRRAWRPGERDSAAAYVVRTRAWGGYSDLAPEAYAAWDSATDVVADPSAAAAPAGVAPAGVGLAPRAPQFESGWGTAAFDILIVFDSVPGGTVQRDSLWWVQTRWWDPADSTWNGYVVHATTASTFGWVFLSTTSFDASGGHSGSGGGEQRLASGTYWEASFGLYRITQNGNYGARQTIASGPYKGGNVEFGLIGGQLAFVSMPRVIGSDAPSTESVNYNFSAAPINAQRIRCYFAPITPPAGYSSCTGAAFASLVTAARSHQLSAAGAAGAFGPGDMAPAPTPRAPVSPRRRRRRVPPGRGRGGPGPLLAAWRVAPGGGAS